MGYSKKYSSLNENNMDKWNLHCFSNHNVDNNKIKLCYTNKTCKMIYILKYALSNTLLDIKDICPVLHEYLKEKNYIE